jgi:hypothetical protein
MTEFSFEHVFRAPAAAAVLAAYFDPDHLAAQDEVAGLIDRAVVESEDDGARLRTSWRVAAKEQLPLFARPFVAGGRLRYLETMTWRRADDAIDLLVQPEVLGGRVQIAAEYRLSRVGEGQVLRRYRGTISVAVKLVAGKIERAVAEKMAQSMPQMAACTQAWLDRVHPV